MTDNVNRPYSELAFMGNHCAHCDAREEAARLVRINADCARMARRARR